jgi:hypothetical protein
MTSQKVYSKFCFLNVYLVLVPLSKSFTIVYNWLMSLLMNFIVNNNLENDVEK